MSKQTNKGGRKTSPPQIYLPMSADLFHIGHLKALQQCVKKGDVTVGLLDCPSYKKMVIPFEERKKILEALSMVKKVVRQKSLKPNLNGMDYLASSDGFEELEKEAIKKWNCKPFIFNYYKSQSTTKIKQKICQKHCKK